MQRVVAEERRLLYVGLTRAHSDVFLYTPTGSGLARSLDLVGPRLSWADLDPVDRGDDKATARIWPSPEHEQSLRESRGFRGQDSLGRWTLRGSREALSFAELDEYLGPSVLQVEVRSDDGVLLYARHVGFDAELEATSRPISL